MQQYSHLSAGKAEYFIQLMDALEILKEIA